VLDSSANLGEVGESIDGAGDDAESDRWKTQPGVWDWWRFL
jgi:hypothetical protein